MRWEEIYMTAYIRYLPADDECGFCSSVLNGQEYDISELMAKDSTNYGTSPDTDIYEKEEKIIFETELPGLSKNDIKIKVQEDILSVSAQKSVDASRKFSEKNVFTENWNEPSDCLRIMMSTLLMPDMKTECLH